MKKDAALPVRLDPDVSRRLDIAAAKLKLTKSSIVRMLAEHFVDQYEAAGGKLVIPPEFKAYDVQERKGNGK